MTFGFSALLIAALLGRNEIYVCAVSAVAESRGLDPALACAVVEYESHFNPRARGKAGDHSLYQVMPFHGVLDGIEHIRQGTGLLVDSLAWAHGDIPRGLSRYNAGHVSRAGLRYARSVLAIKARIDRAIGREESWQERCWSSLARLRRSPCWSGECVTTSSWRERMSLPRSSAGRSR